MGSSPNYGPFLSPNIVRHPSKKGSPEADNARRLRDTCLTGAFCGFPQCARPKDTARDDLEILV